MSVESVKYGDICDKCAHAEYCDMATFGGHNPKITACCKFTERHQTNADRVRAMSDEKLADFLCNIAGLEDCTSKCPGWAFCRTGHTGILDWLQQEADE